MTVTSGLNCFLWLAFSLGGRLGQFKMNQETSIRLFISELGRFCGVIHSRILTIIVSGADCVRLRCVGEHVDTSELFFFFFAARCCWKQGW